MFFQNEMLTGLLLLALAHTAFAGSLQDREKDINERSAAKTGKKNAVPDTQHETARSALGSPAYAPSREGQSFLGGFWSWLVAAPFQYRHDDPSARMSSDEAEWTDGRRSALYPPHVPGQGTVPYVRLDYNRQFTDWDPDDVRLELGYKLVALHGRMTRYTDEVGDDLDLHQYYGVLRYGGRRPDFLPGTFEFGVGLGAVLHTGDVTDDSSGAITVPLKYHPVDWFGVEFRPAWYRWQEITIGDYDLSASLGARFVQLRGGYRWLWDNGMVDAQSGPYAGLSLSF